MEAERASGRAVRPLALALYFRWCLRVALAGQPVRAGHAPLGVGDRHDEARPAASARIRRDVDPAVHLVPWAGGAAATDPAAGDLTRAAEVLAGHRVARRREDHRLGVERVDRPVERDDRVARDL